MNNRIIEIKKLLKPQFSDNDWNYHILLVVKYARLLAGKYRVDREVVELAS